MSSTQIVLKDSLDEISDLLQPYQFKIEEKIRQDLEEIGGTKELQKACAYALLNGGRRFRPALVYMVAEAIAKGHDVTYSALAIEYFHTASLIADDLPCMDNDDMRRNQPSLHKAFGETVALLASYALISAGNRCIALNALSLHHEPDIGSKSYQLGIMALKNAADNTGLQGTTGGQFLDIYPPNLSLSTLREVIQKKTVSLFEVAFVFGWLFGGGKLEKLEEIRECAGHFGMAFQIADDLGDYAQDIKNGRQINMAVVFGPSEALKMFHTEIAGYRKSLKMLGIESKKLLSLARGLEGLIKASA